MEYLFDPQPGPLDPRNLIVHLALFVLLGLSLIASLGLRPRKATHALLGLLALFLILARIWQIPYLSMRIFFFSVLFLWVAAWAWTFGDIARRQGWIEHQLRLLTFSWQILLPPLPIAAQGLLLIVHFVGWALIANHFSWQYWGAIFFLALLYLPLLIDGLAHRPKVLHLEVLTPLFFVYAMAVARWIVANILAIPLYDPFAFPNALNAALSVEAALLAASAYTLLLELYIILWRHGQQVRFLLFAGIGLLAFTLLWASAEYFGHRTHGVTASDPYAYAQMAVDLAERGTPLHRFPLFAQVNNLGISVWPAIHVGYRLPIDAQGDAPTVWPVGGSVFLALGYAFLGEEGLYLVTPILGILSALAIFAFLVEIFHDRPMGERLWAGAWAAFLLATSYEQINWLLVPMADAAAQLFTTLTVLLGVVALRKDSRVFIVAAGLAWGMAYEIRHTQLLMGLSVLLAIALSQHAWNKKWRIIVVFGAAAFLIALPDLIYHQLLFGNFLIPESEELQHFALANIAATLPAIVQRLFEGNEFGYLLVFMLWGAWRVYSEKRSIFWVLASWVLVVLMFQLPYRFLRLRDLLSLYPAFMVLVAYGMLGIYRWAIAGKEKILAIAAIFVVILLPALRVRIILARPLSTYTETFGYVTSEERQGFAEVVRFVPDNGVVGTSLNGGPIDLYAQRDAFRPEVWSNAEFDRFLQAMEELGRAVYILDDGDSLQAIFDYAASNYRLIPVTRLDVPLFGEEATGVLYRVEMRGEE